MANERERSGRRISAPIGDNVTGQPATGTHGRVKTPLLRRKHGVGLIAGGLVGVCLCVAGVLVTLSILASRWSAGDLVPWIPIPTDTPRLPVPLPTSTAGLQPGRLGDVVEGGGYSLSVVAVEHPARPECDPWYYPPPGTELVAVEIVVGCVSGEQVIASPILTVLVDADGRAYMAELGALARHRQLEPTPIGPGEQVQGRVAFEVPVTAVPARVKYIFPNIVLQVVLAE